MPFIPRIILKYSIHISKSIYSNQIYQLTPYSVRIFQMYMGVPAAQSVSHATLLDWSELVRLRLNKTTILNNSKIVQLSLHFSLLQSYLSVQILESYVEKDIRYLFYIISTHSNSFVFQ